MTRFGFKHRITTGLLGVLACTLVSSPLHAVGTGVLFTFSEVGGNVVAQTSGTIDSGWTVNFPTGSVGTDRGVLAFDELKAEKTGGEIFYNTTDWQSDTMGGVSTNTSGVVTGDAFGYGGVDMLIAPDGTTVGDAFTPVTTITWEDETFASMGLDTALSSSPKVLFTLNNGSTISAVLNASAVPGAGLAGLATVGLAGVSRRRRR